MASVGKMVGGAVAGLGLVGAGVAGLGLAGQDDTQRDESGAVVAGGELGAFRIRLGDCFLEIPDGTVESVDAVPCNSPHLYEVYAAFNVDGAAGAAFPGQPVLDEQSQQGCYDRFAPFVGLSYEESIFDISLLGPTQGSWDELDDREVLCLIQNVDGTLKTGSAEGSGK